jgi:DNA-binding response OmpR family regulator
MSGRRIVVVDDEPDITRLIAVVLRDDTILPANNGKDALALIRREHPDLVILDVMMRASQAWIWLVHSKPIR